MNPNSLKIREKFMSAALVLAQKSAEAQEVPVGAIVIKDGVVIGRGQNRKETAPSAVRHAEIEAIEEASKTLGGWRLTGCEMYVTLEPCIMCAGAIVASRLDRLIYGATDPKGGAVDSLYQVLSDSRLNHNCEVVSGVLQQECSKILKDFFRKKREG